MKPPETLPLFLVSSHQRRRRRNYGHDRVLYYGRSGFPDPHMTQPQQQHRQYHYGTFPNNNSNQILSHPTEFNHNNNYNNNNNIGSFQENDPNRNRHGGLRINTHNLYTSYDGPSMGLGSTLEPTAVYVRMNTNSISTPNPSPRSNFSSSETIGSAQTRRLNTHPLEREISFIDSSISHEDHHQHNNNNRYQNNNNNNEANQSALQFDNNLNGSDPLYQLINIADGHVSVDSNPRTVESNNDGSHIHLNRSSNSTDRFLEDTRNSELSENLQGESNNNNNNIETGSLDLTISNRAESQSQNLFPNEELNEIMDVFGEVFRLGASQRIFETAHHTNDTPAEEIINQNNSRQPYNNTSSNFNMFYQRGNGNDDGENHHDHHHSEGQGNENHTNVHLPHPSSGSNSRGHRHDHDNDQQHWMGLSPTIESLIDNYMDLSESAQSHHGHHHSYSGQSHYDHSSNSNRGRSGLSIGLGSLLSETSMDHRHVSSLANNDGDVRYVGGDQEVDEDEEMNKVRVIKFSHPFASSQIFCTCDCSKSPNGEFWSPDTCICYKKYMMESDFDTSNHYRNMPIR